MAETNRKNVDLDILDYYDGKIKNYVDEKASTGGGSYELPIATTEILGGVMVDGTSITADENGVISAVGGGGLTLLGRYSNTNGVDTTIGTISDIPEGTILVFVSTKEVNPDTYFYIGSTIVPSIISGNVIGRSCVGIVSSYSGTVRLEALNIKNDGTKIQFQGSGSSAGTYFDIYKLEV